MGWIIVFGLYNYRKEYRSYDPSWTTFGTACYSGFHKLGWGLVCAWITFACQNGYGGFINKFLSWSVFVPLARMTYMAYLVHFGVIWTTYFSISYAMELTNIAFAYDYLGLSMVIYGIGYLGTLSLEMPFVNLERMIIKGLVQLSNFLVQACSNFSL